MRAQMICFGAIEIEGTRYTKDVVIDAGKVRTRDKTASRPLRDRYGHTPLSAGEPIPWDGPRLIVGTGTNGALPIAPEVREEAARRSVELVAVPTGEACAMIADVDAADVYAVMHLTC